MLPSLDKSGTRSLVIAFSYLKRQIQECRLICNIVMISYNAEMVMELYVALSFRNVASKRTTVFYNKDHIFSQIQNL